MTAPRTRWLVACETAAVPRRTVLLVRTLRHAGLEVDVLCWSRRGADQVPSGLGGGVVLSRGRSLPSFAAELAGRLARGGYDGVVAGDLRLLAVAVFWAMGSGGRVVYDRLEIPSVSLAQRLERVPGVSAAAARRFAEALERGVVARTHGVFSVPVGGDARRHVLSLHPRVAFLSNWPSREEAAGPPPPPSGGPGGGRPFTVLHSGAVGAALGLGAVLAAAALLEGAGETVRWILVGYPADRAPEALRRAVGERGLEARVEVRPRVPYESLPALLAEADVGLALLDPADPKFRFVEPGMSRKAFTYMAAGLPVIANPPQGAWVEAEGAGVLVPFGDGAALADAVRRLAGDPGLRRSLGEAGRAAVASRYHWERQEASILDLVRGPGGGP